MFKIFKKLLWSVYNSSFECREQVAGSRILNCQKTIYFIKQTLRLMIGVPDYQAYVKHIKTNHPYKKIMAYDEFFRERQAARYSGSTKGRCC